MFIGLALIVIGVIALLVSMGVLPGSAWNYLWPVLLILLGLSFIFGKRGHFWGCWRPNQRDDTEKRP